MLSERLGTWSKRIGLSALAVALAMAIFGGPSGSTEDSYGNYANHIEPLEAEILKTGQPLIRKVEHSGRWVYQSIIEVAKPLLSDTAEVKAMVRSGNDAGAAQVFGDLQDVPVIPDPDLQTAPPTLTPGMSALLLNDSANLYQLYLYDSCQEDGDIVDVSINGEFFARVPITHAGATLTVPVAIGSKSSISLTGVVDGGGGVTVAFRSSEGDYFARAMAVGETQPVALIAR
ncbi:MAG: hypothetical protein D8M59_16555 [Planctomycetes bacterium]|nr:hypothetical protein [Planctomycetota bacterium]